MRRAWGTAPREARPDVQCTAGARGRPRRRGPPTTPSPWRLLAQVLGSGTAALVAAVQALQQAARLPSPPMDAAPRPGPPRRAPLAPRRRRGGPGRGGRAAGGGGRRRVAAVTELHDRRGPGRHTGSAAAVSSLGRRQWGRGRRPGRRAAALPPLPWRVWAVIAPAGALGVALVAAGLAGGRPARRRRRHQPRPGLRLAPGRAPGPHPPVAVRRPGRRRPTTRGQTEQCANGVLSRPSPLDVFERPVASPGDSAGPVRRGGGGALVAPAAVGGGEAPGSAVSQATRASTQATASAHGSAPASGQSLSVPMLISHRSPRTRRPGGTGARCTVPGSSRRSPGGRRRSASTRPAAVRSRSRSSRPRAPLRVRGVAPAPLPEAPSAPPVPRGAARRWWPRLLFG